MDLTQSQIRASDIAAWLQRDAFGSHAAFEQHPTTGGLAAANIISNKFEHKKPTRMNFSFGFRILISHPGSVLDKRTEFRFGPNHPFGREVGLCQVLGKCWVALDLILKLPDKVTLTRVTLGG